MDDSGIHDAEGWDSLEDADVLTDPESKAAQNLDDADDEINVDGGAAQIPRGLHAEQGGESTP